MSAARFTCPCCGYRTLPDPPGSFEICPVCCWEDDPVQLLDPARRGGANVSSLVEGQATYERVGACEERLLGQVRPPHAAEVRDPQWRRVQDSDRGRTRVPGELSPEEHGNLETWYYWKRKPPGEP